ncbi:flagellar protein FlaG [Aeromonas veronii]|uniref:flagellar protein FlaG n=1 Tax=Aeromonas veronii TaxID=654 RepID=UPI002AC8240A|nr:flagellar protein FlaG [Aeromonas veronii]MCF5893161.1 flagellar protein FlaG [Aeromonas veronii]
MTLEIGSLSSVNGSSALLKEKSGPLAAQPLSDRLAEADTQPAQAEQPEDKDSAGASTRTGKISDDVLSVQVQNLQDFGQSQGWTVSFSMEQDLNKVVIKVVDSDTKSVIRQIPSEELLAINKRIQALREGDVGASSKLGLLLDSEI